MATSVSGLVQSSYLQTDKSIFIDREARPRVYHTKLLCFPGLVSYTNLFVEGKSDALAPIQNSVGRKSYNGKNTKYTERDPC